MHIFSKFLKKLYYKNRFEKLNIFLNFVKPSSKEIILDVGVTGKEIHYFDNLLEKMNKNNCWNYKIIGLGIENLSKVRKIYNMYCIQYDGSTFPLKDNSVNIVYSNAVIEHVGTHEKQLFFLSEMMRVAKRAIFFTTPNKYFPIELHTKIPFVHFLPKKYADKFYKFIGKEWATGDYMELLSKRDILSLLKQLSEFYNFNYKIISQRFLGFVCTFTVIIFKR